jgi:hypothetical protein
MSVTELAMKPDMTERILIDTLRCRLTEREQGDVTNFVPSGKWQNVLKAGPTVRPIAGGHWWLLNSPSKTAEPVRFWIHSTGFLDMDSLQKSAFRIAQTLFRVFDQSNPEFSKLSINNTQHEVKVPGGFLLPLAISVMACRIASAQANSPEVTIFLETYSNKSHGLKLDALKFKTAFGTDQWLTSMETELSRLMKYSVFNMFQNLFKVHASRLFNLIPEKSSIGFGFSASYVDDKDQPLYSVCKQNTWMRTDSHESFCVLGLHSEMSMHTTHFKEGPFKRVQAYIEGANAISSKQCGHGGINVYDHIGLSTINKAPATGILNICAMLDGIADEFDLVNESIKMMRTCPRNRTEVQVGCIVVQPSELNIKGMIASAVKLVTESTQHWKIDHVISFASLNASAMVLIIRQSWILASEVNRPIVERQQLLDTASVTLKRWKSFLTGRGDGVIGPQCDRRLVHLPYLSESLLTHFDSMLPEKSRQFKRIDNFRLFGAHEIIDTFNDAFSASMNDRILKNQAELPQELSKHIMKCVGCGMLHFGASNNEALRLHLVKSPACIVSDWESRKLVTSADWCRAYKQVIEDYEKFIETSSVEQRESCDSVLKFGSGLLAIGVAGSGKSVVLNEVAKVLNCIFFKDGEILMCAATGLLAESFNDAATTVNSAIGAYPEFGTEPNWNLSVKEWSDLIQTHGKITSNLKVLVNTEVYAQSSNMLQALFEMRLDNDGLKFICLMDGDPPQPMHEDEQEDHSSNRQMCSIQNHILMKHTTIQHLLPEVRVVVFETPKRQLDKNVHALSNAVRYGQAKPCHIQQMRSNPYVPGVTKVDIILCSRRNDMAHHNKTNLDGLPGQVQLVDAKPVGLTSAHNVVSYALRLKVNAPVLFSKGLLLKVHKTSDQRKIVNGARGTILKISADIILVALSGKNLVVEVERERFLKRRLRLEYLQFPLDLGWATTIKRAGGMTFTTTAIDFGFNWSLPEAQLCASAKHSWRMSQAYGAITRSRLLAYFVNAGSFKDSVMLLFLNNQNMEALAFLKALVDQAKMPYFRSQQEQMYLSLKHQEPKPVTKKPKAVSYELFEMLMESDLTSSDAISKMVYAAKYPNVLTNQPAGYYCKGSFTSTESVKVLVKKTHQGHDQQNEIRALKALSGIPGIPTVLGKIILNEETRLVLHDADAIPCRRIADLNADQSANLLRIKNDINGRGWSLHIRDENVWLISESNKIMLMNFEAAQPTANSANISIDAPAPVFALASASATASGLVPATVPNPVSALSTAVDAQRSKRCQSLPTEKQVSTVAPSKRPAPKLDDVDADSDATEVHFSAQFDAFEPKKSKTATLKKVSAWLENSKAAVNMPKFTCKHHGSADTYGEGTETLVQYMLMKYKQLRDHQLEESQLSFVDLGSGHGGIVDEVAVLMSFGTCFGVELEPKRASYAKPLADHFFEVIRQQQLRHSKVEIVLGDFLKCSTTKKKLKKAGLVWINNIKFANFNYRILTLLNDTAPIGCVVVSFESLLSRNHNTGFIMISDEVVPDVADWLVAHTEGLEGQTKQKVYVMRKQT